MCLPRPAKPAAETGATILAPEYALVKPSTFVPNARPCTRNQAVKTASKLQLVRTVGLCRVVAYAGIGTIKKLDSRVSSPYPIPLGARAACGETDSLRCIDARVGRSQQVNKDRHDRCSTFFVLNRLVSPASYIPGEHCGQDALLQVSSQAPRLKRCPEI